MVAYIFGPTSVRTVARKETLTKYRKMALLLPCKNPAIAVGNSAEIAISFAPIVITENQRRTAALKRSRSQKKKCNKLINEMERRK
jgi:hypothetical protein